MKIKSMGDLRVFLTEAMEDVRYGKLTPDKAGHVAKLAAQVNASIHAEIAARTHLELKGMGFNALSIIGEEFKGQPKALEAPTEETRAQQIKRLKKEGKTLGQVQDIMKPESQSERKEISEIFLSKVN